MKTLDYKQHPNLHEKTYLFPKLAPTRKTLTYLKALEYKEMPNIPEQTLPTLMIFKVYHWNPTSIEFNGVALES